MVELTKTGKSIGIIRTSSIGDVVLATACLEMARSFDVRVNWFGREPTLSLIKAAYPKYNFFNLPDVVNLKQLKEYSLLKMDACVDLQGNIRSKSFTRRLASESIPIFTAGKNRTARLKLVGKSYVRGRLLPLKPEDLQPPLRQYEAMLQAFAEALVALGFSRKEVVNAQLNSRPNLEALAKSDVSSAWSQELGFGRWIALAPGAAYQLKQAPREVWIELINSIKMSVPNMGQDVGLVLVGGPGDRKISLDVVDSLSWSGPLLNLVGKLSLQETAFVLSKSKFLLTNDSGLLHISEAVGSPVIALFGPTSEGFGFAPWKSESAVISGLLGCRPCSRHGDTICRYGDKLCFEVVPQSTPREHIARLIKN
jgi:ADP-heptose:LPS heptosyltransferase